MHVASLRESTEVLLPFCLFKQSTLSSREAFIWPFLETASKFIGKFNFSPKNNVGIFIHSIESNVPLHNSAVPVLTTGEEG